MIAYFGIFLASIGLYRLCIYLYEVLKAPLIVLFYFLKIRFGCKDVNIKEKYGDWAAITGSTDGLGKAYARELAARGINVVLISRNLDKLNAVAKEIEHDFLVKTKVIVADFSKDTEVCKHVEEQLDPIPIRILVNNVGQRMQPNGLLYTYKDDELWRVILTNIGPVTQLSRYLFMRLHRENQKGIIVNVSSINALIPLQRNAVYCATKAYIHNLTLALQEEGRPYGIDVQLLVPHAISTNLIHNVKHRNIPNATTFARDAVNRLGKVGETTGYYNHDFEYAVLMTVPRYLRSRFFKFMTHSYFKKHK